MEKGAILFAKRIFGYQFNPSVIFKVGASGLLDVYPKANHAVHLFTHGTTNRLQPLLHIRTAIAQPLRWTCLLYLSATCRFEKL